MYVLLDQTGAVKTYPYSVAQLRKDNPDTSIPKSPSDDLLADFGVYPVADTPAPVTTDAEKAYHTGNVTLVNGQWEREWAVRDKTAGELEQEREQRKTQLNSERDRRISGGFVWSGYTFQSDADSRENISGAATSAVAYIVSGGDPAEVYWQSPDSPFVWLTVDNQEVPLSPADMIAVGNAAMAHKSRHIHAARALKDMATIPSDFTADKYWP